MRIALVEALMELAAGDPRVFLLTADLGFTVVERFAAQFPSRFLNVGVAEANMVGIASGLAVSGFIPYAYSIATFASMRAYEQFRNGPILHHLPVRLIGIGGGYAYGHAGATHFALEDLGIGRIQPNLTVIAPADPAQTRSAVFVAHHLPGSVYFRIGKGGNPIIPELGGRFALDRVEIIREGRDILLLSTGGITAEVVKAARVLRRDGINACVAVAATLSPPPNQEIAALLSTFQHVMTIEEHYVIGGLGSLVAEILAEAGASVRFARLGVKSAPDGIVGSHAYLLQQHGLAQDGIAKSARALLRRERIS